MPLINQQRPVYRWRGQPNVESDRWQELWRDEAERVIGDGR
jgi:hypothetical protein